MLNLTSFKESCALADSQRTSSRLEILRCVGGGPCCSFRDQKRTHAVPCYHCCCFCFYCYNNGWCFVLSRSWMQGSLSLRVCNVFLLAQVLIQSNIGEGGLETLTAVNTRMSDISFDLHLFRTSKVTKGNE